MDISELMRIVRDEGLDRPVLSGVGRLVNDAVVLDRDGDTWTVYLVDERHAVIESTLRTFDSESAALERVLLKLRQVAKARRSRAALLTERTGTVDLNMAIVVFLKNYPGSNDEEFGSRFGTDAAREEVRAILDETSGIGIEWGNKSLVDIGEEVERVMRERHPELSTAALEKLSNYFTYLVK